MPENTNTNKSKYTNLDPNIAAALSYILTPITGVIFFVLEKDDKFVRFHAFQSILLGAVMWILPTLLSITVILALLAPIVGLVGFCVALFLMWKAYNNETYELPFIGKIAKDQVNK